MLKYTHAKVISAFKNVISARIYSPLYPPIYKSILHTDEKEDNTNLILKMLPNGKILSSDELPDLVLSKKKNYNIPSDSSDIDIKEYLTKDNPVSE